MKIVKFIITIVLIVGICFGIPCFIHETMHVDKYFTTAENAFTPGPLGYIGSITQDENITPEISKKLADLVNEYNRTMKGSNKDFYIQLFIVEMFLGIAIIIIGIILLKATNKKLLSYAIILSGVLSIVSYMFLFYAYITSL